MIIYPIRYQDSVDLEGDNDNIIVLLNPPEQRMLQSILNNVESNQAIWLADYLDHDPDTIDKFLAELMVKLMENNVFVAQQRYDVPLEFYETNTGAWTYASTPTAYRAGVWNLANAVNNLVRWDYIPLIRGKYIVRAIGTRGNAVGVSWVKLNGSTVGTIDWYNAGALTNVRMSTSSFDVTEDDIYTLTLQMQSKNASSSGYALQISALEIYRYDDL